MILFLLYKYIINDKDMLKFFTDFLSLEKEYEI